MSCSRAATISAGAAPVRLGRGGGLQRVLELGDRLAVVHPVAGEGVVVRDGVDRGTHVRAVSGAGGGRAGTDRRKRGAALDGLPSCRARRHSPSGRPVAIMPVAACAARGRPSRRPLRCGRRAARFGLLEARPRQHAGVLEGRVGDRADVRVDAAQVGGEVEVQRRGLDAVLRQAGEPREVGVGVDALQIAEQHLLRQELLRSGEVAGQEHRQAELQVGVQPRVQVADLGHARLGEAAALVDHLVLDVDDDPLDDVAHLLHVDGERDDVGPAPALLHLQRLPRDLRQVELGRRVQVVDGVVQCGGCRPPAHGRPTSAPASCRSASARRCRRCAAPRARRRRSPAPAYPARTDRDAGAWTGRPRPDGPAAAARPRGRSGR